MMILKLFAMKVVIANLLVLHTSFAFTKFPNQKSAPQHIGRNKAPCKMATVEILSAQSNVFLKNIIDYGNHRMARQAVGVLEQMSAFMEEPTQAHFTAAIWACQRSDQYNLALSVLEEMKSAKIAPTVSTYEALISLAEKTGHWKEAMDFFKSMNDDNILGNTDVYNACMWAADKGGNFEFALELLDKMEKESIARTETTYEACMWACEKSGAGNVATHVIDLMKDEGFPMGASTYRAAIWANVKGGMWETAINLFNHMEGAGVLPEEGCFNGAIWAHEQAGNHQKAVELLKLMKFEGLKRNTMSFDGALAALAHAGEWEECLEVFAWMDRDVPAVGKSYVTYQLLIDALDAAGEQERVMEMYLLASREGYFVPWVEGTRVMDVSELSLPVAKAAIRNVLLSMEQKKLPLFNLNIIVGDPDTGAQGQGEQEALTPAAPVPHRGEFACLEKGLFQFFTSVSPPGVLVPSRRVLEDKVRLIVSRDSLLEWEALVPSLSPKAPPASQAGVKVTTAGGAEAAIIINRKKSAFT